MTRIFDCFPFHNEVDLLECRLEELCNVVDRFIVVEAGETHNGAKKPSYYASAQTRFARWEKQITHVWLPSLSSTAPEEREHEQREGIRTGLLVCNALSSDIVIQSDLDEIPSAAAVRQLDQRLHGDKLVVFDQTLHYFAVDWLHPGRCEMAPAAARLGDIGSLWGMRKASAEVTTRIPNGGWHFSWLGDTSQHLAKLGAIYEGASIAPSVLPMLLARDNWRKGVHVYGTAMQAIDIDHTFPQYIYERRCPASWFRPRGPS